MKFLLIMVLISIPIDTMKVIKHHKKSKNHRLKHKKKHRKHKHHKI